MEAQPRDDLFQRSNLTRGQLLLWTGQQLHPRTPLYNMAFRFDFRGRIDPRAFRQAFVQLVAESDALRTVVENRAGVPWQVVRPRLDTALSIIDLSTLDDPATVCRELAQASCERPFDLERRLFDAALYRLGDERYAWSFSQHHLVTDAWSVTVLFRRLAELYGGLATGESPDVALLADFQAAVADQRASPTDRETADHWRQQAAHTSQPARLYGQPPAGRSTASERLACDLDEHRSEALVALARRPEARALTLDSSLFNLLATVLLAYLHRISGQTILAVGAPTHNRTSAALRRTAGLLTEVFPLTVEIEPGASFLDLLRAVQRQSQAFLRFARAGASNARQNRGISAVLNFIRGSFDDFAGTPVTAEWLHPRHHDREHALRLHVHDFDGSGRPNLLFDFRCDVFDARRRSEAPGHFSSLLDALLEDWQQPIATVDLLSATEVRRQMVELHPERRAHGTRDSLAQRLARTIEQRPEATALRCGEEHLTYRTLDRLAERLAAKSRRLAAKSRHDTLGDEPIIGLCMQRSTEAFVAILALHRAGTAYLPIDPAWPAERIALVIADAGLSLILTQPMTDEPVCHHARTLQVEPQALHSEEGTLGPTTGPEPSPAAEAYRLYTSGSTGRPKAVVVSRGALTHYVTWASAHYCADAPHNLPLFSPLTFDLTVTSIYLPLVTGGTVVIYPETGRRVDLALLDVVAQNSVDLIKLTPSHLGLLQSNAKGGAQGRSRVRQLIFGGEALNREAALRAVAHFGDAVRIDNEYGPTEATVGCIVHSFDRQADRLDVPIGRPIRGMQAYVLDRMLQPLPEGIVGELYLAGDGLARGYAGRPAHTAERFLPHPFEHGQRLYRSGDLARFGRDPDGRLRLEYLGRGDEQVKIRGARIEPGEIEAVLAQHPQLEDCVVLKLDDAPTARADARLCSRCGLPSTYPQTDLDTAGVCNHCRAFDTYEPRLRRYFGTLDDLRAILDGARDAPTYDCMALYSGGKDSTYALCQLVDMGYRVLAFTLDNGFISEQAKTNILRVVQALGVDHVFGSTPAMNRIFADSLERHANVCQGCFKTIYTLSTQLAQQKGIPFIVTGLSRGQLFETRLTEDLFSGPDLDSERIDQMVLAARKAYHRT
ncbi:MAG: amino acid adenylation domain-containing protein, partial [Acidobacteriota bacterium]